MLGNAQTACGIAQASLALLLNIGLRAQDPMPAMAPSMQKALGKALSDDNPTLRGEAAVALAASNAASSFQQEIVEMASDREEEARWRGILAVGLLGATGADVALGRVLEKAPRASLDRLVAALALGLLPDDNVAPPINDLIRRVSGGNLKRHKDVLASLLLGLLLEPHPSRMTAMREMLQDPSIKDPQLRELLVRTLAQVPSPENSALLADLLDERVGIALAALRALSDPRARISDDRLALIRRMARRHPNPAVRGRSIELLTSRRDPLALDLSPKAIASPHPELIVAGMRAALRLGGGSLRKELDSSTLLRRDPLQQAKMLEIGRGPHDRPFLEACGGIARRKDAPMELRVQAATVIADAGWKSIVPTLSNLFLAAKKPQHMRLLARSLKKLGVDITGKVFPAKSLEATQRLEQRIRALIVTGHQSAVDAVQKALQDKSLNTSLKIEMVRAFRRAHQPAWSGSALRLVPERLQQLVK